MIELQSEECLRVTAQQASRVVCQAGLLWVTREGDLRDLFMTPGDWVHVGPGVTLVSALEPSALTLVPAHRWSTRLTRTFGLFRGLSLRSMRSPSSG
jgi:hypothetical protein